MVYVCNLRVAGIQVVKFAEVTSERADGMTSVLVRCVQPGRNARIFHLDRLSRSPGEHGQFRDPELVGADDDRIIGGRVARAPQLDHVVGCRPNRQRPVGVRVE